ncbi:photolyase [Phakopsora pachyrhizi]|uniref:Photolyase n=1 Tax=Phakopsora pachyrhizi TaxID=170000 RepID=A0AAV0ATV0_PHAPC|nr:photolyase [Phakopsora pachyrhizi]
MAKQQLQHSSTKRSNSDDLDQSKPSKQPKTLSSSPDRETPYDKLLRNLEDCHKDKDNGETNGEKPTVVYWMRMRDLRIKDNRALSLASKISTSSKDKGKTGRLIALHVLSPADYKAHDRSPRRIDFVIRNLHDLQKRFKEELNVPLYVVEIEPRKEIPERVIELVKEWGATHLLANIEHEVDELRRDIKVLELTSKVDGLEVDFIHDTCVVEPGQVKTKENKPYSVFSPWQKNWSNLINQNISDYVDTAEDCKPNQSSIYEDVKLSKLFDCQIPRSVKGFELSEEDSKVMKISFKEGEDAAHKILDNFINSSLNKTSNSLQQATLEKDSKKEKNSSSKQTTVEQYSTLRNRPDISGTSNLSAYLASGVISIRACLRSTLKKSGKSHLMVDRRDLGIGMWQSELGWRDFYQHVMAAWPRVSMGKAFNLKYDDVVWEKDDRLFEAWKNGMTGYPFIDACMRQMKQTGYMHNRGRMAVAMFLTKDLLMDWRLGEKWFMENLVDGDLGSNNGGWQWSSSTGTDSQPYFRIFSPLSQSEKSDPNGEFIKKFCPELKSLTGKAIHEPIKNLSEEKFKKLGYPKPIVDHSICRKRALIRFKVLYIFKLKKFFFLKR